MWQALAGDAANAVIKTATQLYMEKQRRQEEEKKRLRDLMVSGQQGMMEGAEQGRLSSEEAIKQMLSGYTGVLT